MKPALASASVPHGRYENGTHQLRHYFASQLLDQGVSIKAVAEWLGHTDPAFTLATYTHMIDESSDRGRTAIDTIYGRRNEPDPDDGPATVQKATG